MYKAAFILLFAIVFLFFGNELGYTYRSPWWNHLTYMFQHASLFHLTINAVAFLSFYRLVERFIPPRTVALYIVVIGFVLSWVCVYPVVVVGASAMVYALIGMYLYFVAVRKLVYRNRNTMILSLCSISFFLFIGFFNPHSAGCLHLLSIVSGFILIFIHFKL